MKNSLYFPYPSERIPDFYYYFFPPFLMHSQRFALKASFPARTNPAQTLLGVYMSYDLLWTYRLYVYMNGPELATEKEFKGNPLQLF